MDGIKLAVIMAGGEGTRMFPVSDYVPKPLVKINNKELVDHVIDSLKDKGINEIYVTYGYKSELLVSHIEKRVSGLINTINQSNTSFLFNSNIRFIDERILVIPCDIIMNLPFEDIIKDLDNFYYKDQIIVPIKYKEGLEADRIEYTDNRILNINRKISSDLCASGVQLLTPFFINQVLQYTSKDLSIFNDWYSIWKEMSRVGNLKVSNIILEKWETYDRLDQLLKTNEPKNSN